jgi:hypothetical protein
MPELDFRVDGIEPVPYAVAPQLAFRLDVTARGDDEGGETTADVRGIALNCQIRIEPARRRYSPREQERLFELFGEPHRWGQTLRGMLWTHATTNVPPFTGRTVVDLSVPCTFDFNVATTKYFHALDDGEVPLSLLFSGTVFYATGDGTLQVTQIPWEKESGCRLPVAAWERMMDAYYPNTAWLCLRRDAFDRLSRFKAHRGLPTWERALEVLLDRAEEVVAP